MLNKTGIHTTDSTHHGRQLLPGTYDACPDVRTSARMIGRPVSFRQLDGTTRDLLSNINSTIHAFVSSRFTTFFHTRPAFLELTLCNVLII